MSSQGDLPILDAFSTDQTRSRILTPTATSDESNCSDGNEGGSRKRKRDGNTMADLLKDSFIVRPYPAKVPAKPRSLQPLLLLPRSRLPLSYIDTISSSNSLPHSRLFETHVKILELEERIGNQPMVLVARLDDERTLYAIEREDRGLYVLCKLGSWVNIQQLRAAAAVARPELPKSAESGFTFSEVSRPSTSASISESGKFGSKKRLAIEALQSMVKRPSSNLLPDSQINTPCDEPPSQDPSLALTPSQLHQHAQGEDITTQPTAAEIFDNVRSQYFDTLYLSKASLAYFAKGPLSRARAAFHLDYDSTLDMNDHIAFLESLIMSTSLIDKKYRDGVPSCISLLDTQDHSGEEAANAKVKKRRNAKKMKPGKNGLYPIEDDLIRRWWSSHDDEVDFGGPDDSKEGITKARTSQLRIRETQLQMILILEVLALQPLASATEEVESGLPGISQEPGPADSNAKGAKAKKPDQLVNLIDVHIDRLSIWQSLAQEIGKAHVGGPQTTSETTSKQPDNILRDFCIEVIAPFFSARLPDRCTIINRKLGGPVAVSPPRPKVSKSSSSSGIAAKPGAATKRPVPLKPRRSLKRVLTDERERRSMSAGPSRAISLMRSATMPAGSALKREASEAPSLSSIPSIESQHRGGVMKSKRFAQREVDFSSLAPEMNSKAKKQARIEAELKEAIDALKKPNRELAGKVLVETAEQRTVSAAHPRKSKKPVRNPLFQGVQITATPKSNRQFDMFANRQKEPLKLAEKVDSGVALPSSLPRIPQSSLTSLEKGPNRNPFFNSVQATPTRRPTISSQPSSGLLGYPSVEQDRIPPSSPVHVRRSSASLFPKIPDSAAKEPPRCIVTSGLHETPIKPRPKSYSGHGHPEARSLENDKENETTGDKSPVISPEMDKGTNQDESIYKSLGWDDDMDELA